MGLKGVNDFECKKNSVVAIVPAKLTSVRLPKKNMADFSGHPLFYYSVRVAQLCPSILDVFVSSESNSIIKLAEAYGSKVIKRPESLSSPEITNVDVLFHSLEQIAKQNEIIPEFLILLQPTHPLRFPEEIEKGIQMLINNPDADTLITVLPDDRLNGQIKSNQFIPTQPLPRNKKIEPEMFFNTGSFYIFRTATTISKRTMFTDNILPLPLEHPEFEVDIDIESDLTLARYMIEANKEKFSFFWN